MKNLLFSISILLASVYPAYAQIASPQKLADTYKSLHENGKVDEMIELFYMQDAAPLAISSTKSLLEYEMQNGTKIESVTISEIGKEALQELSSGFPYQGKLLVPTISQLSHTMKVQYKTDDPDITQLSGAIHLGKTDLGYLFTSSKLVEAD